MDGTVPASDAHRPQGELRALTDEDVIASLKAGCNDALAVLFDRYHRLVLSIAPKIVRDPAEAEDVMQIVFLDIFRAVAQFDPSKGTTKLWILQYAYHRAINRRQYLTYRNFYNSPDIEEIDALFPGVPLTQGGLSNTETRRLIQQGLAQLNQSQKRVIELAIYDGLSMKEIADKTGDSLANVRHFYYRGLRKLRTFVNGTQAANCA